MILGLRPKTMISEARNFENKILQKFHISGLIIESQMTSLMSQY